MKDQCKDSRRSSDFHESLEIHDFDDFSLKFCISMGIILRVTRASDDEF